MDGDDYYDSGDSMPKLEETQPYFCLSCEQEIPCDHCMEGISSRPFSPRSWGLKGFKGLLPHPLRRTSPPRSSPPCEVLRPASPLPQLESQEITIRPPPKLVSDTTTAIVDSSTPNSSNSSEGSTTFQPAKKKKVNPSEEDNVILAVLEPTTMTTTINNEESDVEKSYVYEFKCLSDMKAL